MPSYAATSSPKTASSSTSYGQVIEYIQGQLLPVYLCTSSIFAPSRNEGDKKLTDTFDSDRLYLASYTHPPNAHTPFPYPQKPSRSPTKRSSRAQGPVSTGPKVSPPVYFSIDRSLRYNAFHADFGPLHIGHLYRFAVQLHEVLADPANEDRGVVFWSYADARSTYI